MESREILFVHFGAGPEKGPVMREAQAGLLGIELSEILFCLPQVDDGFQQVLHVFSMFSQIKQL